MTRQNNHATVDELEMLRAGLLDDEPARQARVLDHIAGCPDCEQRFAVWDRVVRQLDDGTRENTSLSRELRMRRQAVLAGQDRADHGRWRLPRVFVVAAAVIALGLGLGLFTTLQSITPISIPGFSRSNVKNISDFYAEIDFYVWLADQELTPSSKEHKT